MSAADWAAILGPLASGLLGGLLGARLVLRGKAPPDASKLRATEKKHGAKKPAA